MDWPKKVSFFGQLPQAPGATVGQMPAVQNALGNAYVRLVEPASKGNPEAKATLQMLSEAADRLPKFGHRG